MAMRFDGTGYLQSTTAWPQPSLGGSNLFDRRQEGVSTYNSGQQTATLPQVPVEGNLLVAHSNHRQDQSTPQMVSAGWTYIDDVQYDSTDGSHRRASAVWYKFAGPSESQSVTIEWNPDRPHRVVIQEYSFAGSNLQLKGFSQGGTQNPPTQFGTVTNLDTDEDLLCISTYGFRGNVPIPTFNNVSLGDAIHWTAGATEITIGSSWAYVDPQTTSLTTTMDWDDSQDPSASGSAGHFLIFSANKTALPDPSVIIVVSFWMLADLITPMRMFGSGGNLEGVLQGDGKLRNDIYGANVVSAATINAGQWYHIVMAGDPFINATYTFIDGTLDSFGTPVDFSDLGNAMRIGVGPGNIREVWQGVIDDFRTYNRVLPAAEIEDIIAAEGRDANQFGITGNWRMDELPAGTAVPDIEVGVNVADSDSPASITLNIGSSGTDRLVVAVVSNEGPSSQSSSGITVDGKACTFLGKQDAPDDNGHIEMWYILESDLGSSSGNVTVQALGTDSGWAIAAQLYTGVEQGPPIGWTSDADLNISSITLTGSDPADAGSVAIMAAHNGDTQVSVDYSSPLVERTVTNPQSSGLSLGSGVYETAVGSISVTADHNGTRNRIVAIAAGWRASGLSSGAPVKDIGPFAAHCSPNGNPPVYEESRLSFGRRYYNG